MTKVSEVNQDSSSSFSEDNEKTRVRKFAKHMLKSTLFIGTFQEKRFVEPLSSYRDVIKVADDETDFIENLIAVRKRCVKLYVKKKAKNVWIGITEPKTIGAPAGYNLWVTLDKEVFGSYWYKIKTVDFHENEVCLKLEVVRPVSREKTPVHNITAQGVLEDISKHDVSELGAKVGNYFREKFSTVFAETFTASNIKEAIVFIFLLLSTLLTFLIQAVRYLLEYFLKVLHESSTFIKACTPIIISFMKLITNTINGFYSLIALMWRNRSPPTINQNLYQISPYDYQYVNAMRALPPLSYHCEGDVPRNAKFHNYRSSVKITPLD